MSWRKPAIAFAEDLTFEGWGKKRYTTSMRVAIFLTLMGSRCARRLPATPRCAAHTAKQSPTIPGGIMTDPEIIKFLQEGGLPTFGMHGRNMEVINLMDSMEKAGLIRTDDASLSQETRRSAVWISDERRNDPPEAILASITQSR